MTLTETLKGQFPLLNQSDLVYLDSSATTQKPLRVINRLQKYYLEENANVHRSLYTLGADTSERYEEGRNTIQRFLNARHSREIIFTSGTTASLNLLADSFCRNLDKGDRILLTEMEHHSNLVPWQMAAKRQGLILDFIEITDQGKLNLSMLEQKLTSRTRLISLTHISNLLGTVNPVKEIIALAHKKGIPVALDAAQSAARIPIDVQSLDCDFLALSGHKLYGPTGTGILYGKEEWLEKLEPWMGGGDMISSVSLKESSWNELPWKFEAGTPNIAGFLGLSEAVNWLEDQGRDKANNHEKELTRYAWEQLSGIEELELYGPGPEDQLGVISLNIKGLHAHDSTQFLSHKGLCLRAGHHCAQPLIKKLGVPSTLRASFGIYNTLEDIDKLVLALKETINYFKSKGII